MSLWRITKNGATIGHVATTEGWPDEAPYALDVAVRWGVIPMDSEREHDAVLIPDDAVEGEARQRIRSIPDLAAHEEAAIAAAKRQTRAVDVLDTLCWLVWGNAAGVRHWVMQGAPA